MLRIRTILPALLLAGSAAAAPLGGPAPGQRLAPGTRVEVTWSVAARGSEAELLLSLDGGATWPLRLTAETEPAAGALSFRVPNLPTDHAVVALRTGEDGAGEEIRGTTTEFVITTAPGSAAEPLFAVEGELATREAAEREAAPPPPSGLDTPSPSLRALAESADPAEGAALLPEPPPLLATGLVAERVPARVACPPGLRAAICLPKRE